MARDVLVIGAGVIGLTTAVVLAERGDHVRVWARDVTPNTTSDSAGAFWLPYLCGPRDAVVRWSATGLEVFRRLAVDDSASGCGDLPVDVLFDAPVPDPAWSPLISTFRSGPATGRFAAAYRHMQSFEAPVVDVTRYMPYLTRRAAAAGAEVEARTVARLEDGFDAADVVVNCTGLGSRLLADDHALIPVRGQTVRARNWGLHRAVIDEDGHNQLAFILPRGDHVVLGATAQRGDWRTSSADEDTAAILARCRALDPGLPDLELVGTAVGLRPLRPDVRLESARTPAGLLVHNYGHGGAGFTLSWGCAMDVADIMARDL